LPNRTTAAGRAEERMATCPECDAEIEVDEFDVDKGDQLSCPECGSNLEVTSLSPIELDIAPEDDDDDDLDDDDDDVEEEDAEDDEDEDEEDTEDVDE
jgi:alpha-aminoadipate carrier protein LysW